MEEHPKNITPAPNGKNRFAKIYLTLWTICVVIGLIALILYKEGYRLGKGFETIKVGSVSLTANENDLQIFIDNREKKPINRGGQLIIPNIIPGTRTILVSKAGFWPWTKTTEIPPNNIKSLYAFVFPMAGLNLKKIQNDDREYAAAKKSISEFSAPVTTNKVGELSVKQSESDWVKNNVPGAIISSDGKSALFVGNNTIYIAWLASSTPPDYFCDNEACQNRFPITYSASAIKNVSFYKDKSNVVLFSAGGGIYGIEADRKGVQNFQPILLGINPYFSVLSDGTIYIKDGENIFKGKF